MTEVKAKHEISPSIETFEHIQSFLLSSVVKMSSRVIMTSNGLKRNLLSKFSLFYNATLGNNTHVYRVRIISYTN